MKIQQAIFACAATFVAGFSFGAPLAARVAADFAGATGPIRHYAVPAMSELQRLPDAYPTDGVPGGTVEVVVAKDEYEDASFLVWPVSNLGKVQLEVSDLELVQGPKSKVQGDSAVRPKPAPVIFPKEDVDLRVVKVWYQNRNAWFSYFGDTGFKLCPELLLHDEDMIRVDTKKVANYARLTDEKGNRKGEVWLNPPREMSRRELDAPWVRAERFQSMRGDFGDAATLQPVTLTANAFKQFFLTVHAKKNAKPGLYRGEVRLIGQRSKVKGQTEENKRHRLTSDLGPRTSDVIATIPVALRVLDFELPQPKCYMASEKDFLVAMYECCNLGSVLQLNGYDVKKAKSQLVNMLRNQVAHNEVVHWNADNLRNNAFITFDCMKEAGKRMDIHLSCFCGIYGDREGDTRAQRIADELDRRIGNHNSYIGYGDEPGVRWLEQARGVYEQYQKAGLKFIIAGGDQVFDMAGYVYDWCNVAKDPSRGETPRLWNAMQNDNHVAWYANQHVGSENPAFNRRQNGLAPYLSGYTALCNYENAIGPWNDDSTTYRPMVMAYAAGDGLVDTLQWEGFREGVDDIRYATLLTDLGRTAQKSKDLATRYLGGQAMQYLAELKVTGYDANTVRGEMIGYIEKLLKVAKPSAFKTSVVNDEAAARAGAARGEANLKRDLAAAEAKLKAAQDEVAKAKEPRDVEAAQRKVTDAHRAVAAAYKRYFRFEEAGDYLVNAGLPEEAAAYEYASGGCYQHLPEKQEAAHFAALKAHTDKGTEYGRGSAFWALLPKHPELMKSHYENVFFARYQPTDTNAIKRAVAGIFESLGRWRTYMVQQQFVAQTAMYAQTLVRAKKFGVTVPAKCARNVCEGYLILGNGRAAAEVAKEGLKDPKAEAWERAFFALAAPFATYGGDEKGAAALAKKVVEAELKDIKNADRVKAIQYLGEVLYGARREGAVRGLETYRLSLYKPEPKKRYVVKYSETPILGIQDMEKANAEEAAYDRAYGGDMEFLTTDVTTGNRGAVGSSKGEKLSPPAMKVVADYQGLHILVTAKDPKAKEIELGLVGDYSFEGYIAPGPNTPYVCTMAESLNRHLNIFNTMYDAAGNRGIREADVGTKIRFDRAYREGEVLCYFFYSWENWPTMLPKNGSVWDYENMCWHRAGNSCWNGTASIHGRSTWGEFEFALTDAQRAAMVRPLFAKALAAYKTDKAIGSYSGSPTAIGHWADRATGDPAFYTARVEPLVRELDRMTDLVGAEMSDATVLWLEQNALPRWHDVRFEIDRRRAEWLRGKQTGL